MNPNLHAVILAGGSGTRFWPLSRETCPKQMLQVVGEDSLLRQTIKRINGLIPPKNIWIVTTEDKAQDMRFHLDPLGSLAKEIQFISEPVGRNTAPAVGLAAMMINHLFPESTIVVMPSDHAIPDKEKFLDDLKVAIDGAKEDYLITFGIKPYRPETGYGYIKIENCSTAGMDGLFKVERFVEKPNLEAAKAYLSGGMYFWNSGIFVWKTSKILSEIAKYVPSLYEVLTEIEQLLYESPLPNKLNEPNKPNELSSQLQHSSTAALKKFSAPCTELYTNLEPISIDYGVMERSRSVFMVPATFRWSDLGSWTALDDMIVKDDSGNIAKGNTVDLGSQNSTIFASDRLVATIGLKDMVVVDTPDATLVTTKEKVQEVKKIVELLKEKGREEYLLHKTVERPWGTYTVLEKGQGYKIKRLFLKPGARLSMQLHRKRSEHWVVVAGVAKVTKGNETYQVRTNESTYIPINSKHRLENPEKDPLQIIEVQNGEYLGEDDIERFDDDYGRICTP
jgi:mannose-1-phosphate guanylyltransferase/mannose-6-phosphate isomerase-like protein (cupin superfamily)